MRIISIGWRIVDRYGIAVAGLVCMTVGCLSGCAAGSSSTITPAKSTAEQKTLTVTAPAKRKRSLIVRVPAAPAVPSPVVEEDVE